MDKKQNKQKDQTVKKLTENKKFIKLLNKLGQQ